MKMERILIYSLGKEVAEYSFVYHKKSNLEPKAEEKMIKVIYLTKFHRKIHWRNLSRPFIPL